MQDWFKLDRFGVRFALALIAFVVCAGASLFAQAASGVTTVEAPQLTSVGAVVAAAIFGTAMVKRVLVNVPVAQDVPVWLYVVVLSVALTYLANQVFGTLEGSLWVLIWNGVYNGAAASGLYEWVTSGMTKPMQATALGR